MKSSPSIVHVSQIVQVLESDAFFVDERLRFVSQVGIPAAVIKQLEDRYVMATITGYEYFTKLIQESVYRSSLATLGQLKEILRECGFLSVVDSLKSLGNDSSLLIFHESSSSIALCFGVLKPVDFFVGREDELNQLYELFLTRLNQPVVVICGMGGQGKTELCRQFIKIHKNQNDPPKFVWLRGDSADNLAISVVQLAHSLKIPATIEGRSIPLDELLEQVSQNVSLASYSTGWLVVIDNVEDIYPEFGEAVPILVRHGAFVVVTTRQTGFLSEKAVHIKLNTLQQGDSQELIRQCLGDSPPEEDMQKLSVQLGNHPLAIRQALLYIKDRQKDGTESYGIKDYLQEFARNKSLLNYHINYTDGYNDTVLGFVARAIEKIRDKRHGQDGELAVELLQILCLVSSVGISVKLLKEFQSIVHSADQAWYQKLLHGTRTYESDLDLLMPKALFLLAKYSLVSYNANQSVTIHRLVQKAAKYNDASCLVKLINGIEPKKCFKEGLQQVIPIWSHADIKIVKKYPKFAIQIFNRMLELSILSELMPFAESNCQILTKFLGPDHPETLEMEGAIARSYQRNGEWVKANEKFYKILQKKSRVFGEEHASTWTTAGQIAKVYWHCRKHKEALKWYESVLKSQARVQGSNHEKTMLTRHNMARVLDELGRRDEAVTHFRQTLEWRVKKFGGTHASTLSTRHYIAAIHFRQGRLEEAKSEFEIVVRLRTRVLGEEDAETLNSKGWLASTLWNQGKRDEGLKMAEGVLASQEKVLGVDHPVTKIMRRNIQEWKKTWLPYVSKPVFSILLVLYALFCLGLGIWVEWYFYGK